MFGMLRVWISVYTPVTLTEAFLENLLFFIAGRTEILGVDSVVGWSYGPVASFREDGVEHWRSMNSGNFVMSWVTQVFKEVPACVAAVLRPKLGKTEM